jgi:hypothetical protein
VEGDLEQAVAHEDRDRQTKAGRATANGAV